MLAPEAAVSDLLLDQRIVAGIGNEYKCEVLFLERIHPLTPVSRLGNPDSLVGRARRLMRPNATAQAPRTTTGDHLRARATFVFERTGKPCRRCRTAIVQGWVGAPHPRITYWCPTCQPEPAPVTGSVGIL